MRDLTSSCTRQRPQPAWSGYPVSHIHTPSPRRLVQLASAGVIRACMEPARHGANSALLARTSLRSIGSPPPVRASSLSQAAPAPPAPADAMPVLGSSCVPEWPVRPWDPANISACVHTGLARITRQFFSLSCQACRRTLPTSAQAILLGVLYSCGFQYAECGQGLQRGHVQPAQSVWLMLGRRCTGGLTIRKKNGPAPVAQDFANTQIHMRHSG